MKYVQTAPSSMELRELADSALYQLDLLEAAATCWLRCRRRLAVQVNAGRRNYDRDEYRENLKASSGEETRMFDALEAFLTAWARISLILFPSAKRERLRLPRR